MTSRQNIIAAALDYTAKGKNDRAFGSTSDANEAQARTQLIQMLKSRRGSDHGVAAAAAAHSDTSLSTCVGVDVTGCPPAVAHVIKTLAMLEQYDKHAAEARQRLVQTTQQPPHSTQSGVRRPSTSISRPFANPEASTQAARPGANRLPSLNTAAAAALHRSKEPMSAPAPKTHDDQERTGRRQSIEPAVLPRRESSACRTLSNAASNMEGVETGEPDKSTPRSAITPSTTTTYNAPVAVMVSSAPVGQKESDSHVSSTTIDASRDPRGRKRTA